MLGSLFRAPRRHPERGGYTVEFAMVLSVLMAVTLGTIDLGRMVIAKEMCAYAAIVGARTAAANSTASTSAVQTAAINCVPMVKLTTSNVAVAVSGSTTVFGNRTRGDTVTVTVTYTYTPLIPKISKIISTGKAWTIKSAMVVP